MLRASDLKEATAIVDRISWCDRMLTGKLNDGVVHLPLVFSERGSASTQAVPLPKEARDAAFRHFMEHVRRVRAEAVRRANQIGLVL